MYVNLTVSVFNSEEDLELDVRALYDYCTANQLNFIESLMERVANYGAYSALGTEDEREYVIRDAEIDAEGIQHGILDTDDMEVIASGLKKIMDWHLGLPSGYDDEELAALLAVIGQEVRWTHFDFHDIKGFMKGKYQGTYYDVWDYVEECFDNGALDPIPDWVSYNEEGTIESLLSDGHFTAVQVGYSRAIFTL